MASDAPVLLSDGRLRLEPVSSNDGSRWQVFAPGSARECGQVQLRQPEGRGTSARVSIEVGPASNPGTITALADAVRLVCRWAFTTLQAPVITWLGPTDASLRAVVQQAGFRIHPHPHRGALVNGGNPADAWYADLLSSDPDTPVEPTLTIREQQVLADMARGYSNAEIARHLNISENTVKNHVRSILEALQATSRTAAVVTALRTGLASLTAS